MLEVLSAGLGTGVHEVFSAHAGFPQDYLAPAFAAPLKGGDVGLDDDPIDGQVGVLFHDASPVARESFLSGFCKAQGCPASTARCTCGGSYRRRYIRRTKRRRRKPFSVDHTGIARVLKVRLVWRSFMAILQVND